MSYNIQRKKLGRHLLLGGALFAAGLGVFSCSDKYDLDKEQPSGLNSIYGYMQEQGNFTNYLKLIDDLGQTEILSKTGSKTMFIANDEAFAKFFEENPWGVKSYSQLNVAQKKLLLNSAMIDNPYSTSMLSTAEGPVKGEVCRRSSSLTLYDSVLVVIKNQNDDILPQNARFQEVMQKRDTLVLFTDASGAAPMLHFAPRFLVGNKIESSDIDFIYNDADGVRKSDDVYVNNAKVINANIFCKNGFIHQVDKVITPLDNMAEVIRKNPHVKMYSDILERFAVPMDSTALTQAYNGNRNTTYDSIFVKRYFAKRSAGSTSSTDRAFTADKNGNSFDASLKYDPGWNQLVPAVSNTREGMMEDMAVMLVPTDDALRDWFDNKGGKVIKDYYGSIEETPNSTISDLVNVNMLVSFVQSVPSKFADVLNDANEPLGITKNDIVAVDLACNGAIYYTNKVFAPTSYSSVLFPTVVDTTQFKIVKNAIDNLDYAAYLNSMVSRYIFLVPTNKALSAYIDPVSYGQKTYQLWEFGFDPTKSAAQRINANIYNAKKEDGEWVKDGDKITTGNNPSIQNQAVSTSTVMGNRYTDILDNIIIVEGYKAGKSYYRTKGNNFVRVNGVTEGSTILGSMNSSDSINPLVVKEAYTMENGHALVLDGIVQTTSKSVSKILSEHPEFSDFFDIMRSCNAISKNDSKDGWQAGDQVYGNLYNEKSAGAVGAEDAKSKKATYLLNNFHYTIYAPTNEAMARAHAAGLPTLEDLALAEEYDAMYDNLSDDEKAEYKAKGYCAGDSTERVQEAMLDFVKYHIQDNSIYLDEGFNPGAYESGKTELIRSTDILEGENFHPGMTDKYVSVDGIKREVANYGDGFVEYYTGKYSPGRPYKINITGISKDQLTLVDAEGNEHKTVAGLTNLQAREYWYKSGSAVNQNSVRTTQLDNSSSVVIHGIDGALLYDSPSQFTYVYKPVTVAAGANKR